MDGATENMELAQRSNYFYHVAFFFMWLVVLFIFRKSTSESSGSNRAIPVTAAFKKFQYNYLLVYLIMMAADWLQGPYVYALYSYYGFQIDQIGVLFVVGFGTSLVFGTFAGSAADKYGRKFMCLVFAVTYGVSCITKHFNNFRMLLFGRFLAGISTSLLFSAFDSWMINEHHSKGYPSELLPITFSLCTAGNGIVAIGSGVLAGFVRDSFGPVAPFDVSLVFLAIGFGVIFATWEENRVDSESSMLNTLGVAVQRLREDRKVLLLGIVQSFFEGAMYIFVFMWTPALENSSSMPILHGWVFATFMICVLIGSNVFSWLVRRNDPIESFTFWMILVAMFSICAPCFAQSLTARFFAMCVFEICVGIFWPSLGTLRSRYIPEEVRATMMNFFRVPLNLIVVTVLLKIKDVGEKMAFWICGVLLFVALVAQMQLIRCTVAAPEFEKKTLPTEEPLELDELGGPDTPVDLKH